MLEEDKTEERGDEVYCYKHPDRPTRVRCSTCGKPICPDCMVFGPVGVKCKEDAALSKSMLRGGKPSQYVGAVAYGLVAALVGGFIVYMIRSSIPFAGFFSFFIYGGYGYAVGEAVAQGAKGNRGTAFMAIAGICAAVGLLPVLAVSSLLGVLFIGVAVFVAAMRLASV
ncbi:MAG: B-box zinc finger protein [Candidatus Aquicultorales bacterium]